MKLSNVDCMLIEKAKSLSKEREVNGGVVKEVGSALITTNDEIFCGVSLDIWVMPVCGEQTAIANMVTNSEEYRIKTIVAFGENKILYPCGRCRETINQIHEWNRENTDVIISETEKVKLKTLLPYRGD